MIGMSLPKGVTELAVRAIEALERIADAVESIDRGQTMARLGNVSRERIASDTLAGRVAARGIVPDCGLGSCPVDPADGDLDGSVDVPQGGGYR